MAVPIFFVPLAKMAAGALGKAAIKAYFIAKMSVLKASLTPFIGAGAANISIAVLATGCTAAYWEMYVKKNGSQKAIEAAVAKGMTRTTARGVVRWLRHHLN